MSRRCSYCEACLDQILSTIKENHQQVVSRLDSIDNSIDEAITTITTLSQIAKGNIERISKLQDSVDSLERRITHLSLASPKPGASRERQISDSSPDTPDGKQKGTSDPRFSAQVDTDRKKNLSDYYESHLKGLKMTGLTKEVFVNMWLTDKQLYMKKNYPDAKLHPTLFADLEKAPEVKHFTSIEYLLTLRIHCCYLRVCR
jgi:hypothetical protein